MIGGVQKLILPELSYKIIGAFKSLFKVSE